VPLNWPVINQMTHARADNLFHYPCRRRTMYVSSSVTLQQPEIKKVVQDESYDYYMHVAIINHRTKWPFTSQQWHACLLASWRRGDVNSERGARDH
jgi:hypothetical protein